MGTLGAIVAALIGAAVSVGTAAYQSSQTRSAQNEARGIAGRESAEDKRRWNEQDRLAGKTLALNEARDAESKRQFDVTSGLKKEDSAWTRYQSQFNRLAGVMSQNQQIEDLYINRLKGLRG